MARKTKEEASRARQQIIDAARKVLHQHGVARSTFEQVAASAGLTRGAVYWQFKDKMELFHATQANVFDLTANGSTPCCSPPPIPIRWTPSRPR